MDNPIPRSSHIRTYSREHTNYASSKLEILTSDGTWIEAPQDKQIPLLSDYTTRTFAVDITGLFPEGTAEYIIRLTNFWNVTYDYIGIDTAVQQDITITTLKPTFADFYQLWETTSETTGAFTRYGNVTALLQDTDDMYIIGRQGDQINVQFYSIDLPELTKTWNVTSSLSLHAGSKIRQAVGATASHSQ